MDKNLADEAARAPESDRRAVLLAALRTGGIAATPTLLTLLDPHRAEADVIVGSSDCDLTTGAGCGDIGDGG